MNFWSRFVFGFLLAQVLPGILCLFFLFFISVGGKIISTSKAMGFADYLAVHAQRLGQVPVWLGCFFVAAACLGIVLHWLNWLVIARLEQRVQTAKLTGIEALPWHRRPFFVQVLVWPLDLIREFGILFFATPDLEKLIRREKITLVPPEKFAQLSWIEDFNLPFAQFLSNLHLAMIPALVSVIVVFNFAGFTARRCIVLFLTYSAIGLVRVLSRQQLISLSRAEEELIVGRQG
jgi:hypothetical protein